MNKAEFIAELSDRLAILTEEERQDILDEYQQHIDMKVLRGMSEEAAITDFGKIEELTADILEAYHVRANMQMTVAESGEDILVKQGENSIQHSTKFYQKIWHNTKHMFSSIWSFCKKIGSGFCTGILYCGKIVQTGVTNCILFCRKPFEKSAIKNQETEEFVTIEEIDSDTILNKKQTKKEKRWHTFFSKKKGAKMRNKERFSITKAITYIVQSCVLAVRWCFRWIWNLFWGGTGILFGLGSCIVIFIMGMLAVLRIQGYPLTGVMIGGVGFTLCMVSVTIWCFSLMIVKKAQNTSKKTEENYVLTEEPSESYTEEISKKLSELSEVIQEEEEEMFHA